MVHRAMIKILILVLIASLNLMGQSNSSIQSVGKIAVDTSFRFSDYHLNYALVQEQELLYQHAKKQELLFQKVKSKYKHIYNVRGVITADGNWSTRPIKTDIHFVPSAKKFQISISENIGDLVVYIDAKGGINASLTPKPRDQKTSFSGELLPELPTREFNRCYIFFPYDILAEINHPNFSAQEMDRILEGYMLLIEEDNWGSYAYKVIFRGLLEVKDTE